MYFAIMYPENIQKYYKTISSELVDSVRPSDNILNYKVIFKQKVMGEINSEDVPILTEKSSGYNLNIVDKDEDIIAIFNDIYGFIGYEPGVSNSKYIDDAKK